MRYNVFTVAQFATITEISIDSINTKLKWGSLTKCYPLPRYDGCRESVFILRDEKSKRAIERALSKK